MTTFDIGRQAEAAAAQYLHEKGFEILSQNWRTKTCEIDIVARKSNIVHFVEVKYRKSDTHGSGVEYVTPKKLQQMQYAAEMWVSEHGWDGDYRLGVVEATGEPPRVTVYLDDIY